MNKMELKPIGVIHTPFQQPQGTPIQPVKGKGVRGWIELDIKPYIAKFDRIEIQRSG